MDIPEIKSKLAVSGIYAIVNLETGRRYVGSATYIGKRWGTHRILLRKGAHHSIILQRSWDKYGEAAHKFQIIEIVRERGDLIAREQYWIDTLQAFHPTLGFNTSSVAGSTRGVLASVATRLKQRSAKLRRHKGPHSRRHRENISKALKGRKHPNSKEWVRKVRKTKKRNKRLGGIQLAFPFWHNKSRVMTNLPPRDRS